MSTGLIVLIVFGCLFGGCLTVCGIAAHSAAKDAAATGGDKAATASGASTASALDPNYVAARKDACARYKAESNQIKASKVFADFFDRAGAAGYSANGLSGTIEKIETSHGGGSVIVEIKTKYGEFSSNDLMQGDNVTRSIQKGSTIYTALADLIY